MSSDGPKWNLNQLFGRDAEIETLENVNGGFVVIHGNAGSGKSALIRSFPWEEKKGYVLACGKFEQQRQQGRQYSSSSSSSSSSLPYSAVIEALNDLVDQWSEHTTCSVMKGGLSELLEEDIQFLKDILPKMVFTAAGVCPTKMELALAKSKHHHHYSHYSHSSSSSTNVSKTTLCSADCINASFRRILAYLCRSKPVVLFLDDIQYADKASMDALQVLAGTGEIPNLILALSYRDEDVYKNGKQTQQNQQTQQNHHPVMDLLTLIEESGQPYQNIHIQDLPVTAVNQLVSSLTGKEQDLTLPLSEVIHAKTAGNPFFVVQFLQLMRQNKILSYSFSTFKWEWQDVNELQKFSHISDNVADVIAANMKCLPIPTQVVLKVSSCLGKVIPLNIMTEHFEAWNEAQDGQTCCLALHHIQIIGLKNILTHAVESGVLIQSPDFSAYMWSHDKLQQVAYSLLDKAYRKDLHLRLGKILWKHSAEQPDEEWMVFMAADQINRYSEVHGWSQLGPEIAKLNLRAAKLSISKSALYPAVDFLVSAGGHLDSTDRWTEHYDLCLEIFSTLAEIAIQIGNRKDATIAVMEVDSNAKSLEDKFRAQLVLIKSASSGKNRDYGLAAENVLEVLRLYGEKFPKNLLPGQLFVENQKLKAKLPGKKLEGLLELPMTTDERATKIVSLLIQYGQLSFMHSQNRSLSWYAGYRALNIACSKGITVDTPYCVVHLGAHMMKHGNYKEACSYGELAFKLLEKHPEALGLHHSKIITVTESAIFSGSRPFNNSLDNLVNAHEVALKTGNTELAGGSVVAYAFTYFCVGLPLGPLDTDLRSYFDEARQLRLPYTIQLLFLIFRQFIHNLQELPRKPALLNGDIMNAINELEKVTGPGRTMTKRDIDMFQLILAVVYGEWDNVEDLIATAEPYLENDFMFSRQYLRLAFVGLASLVIARKQQQHHQQQQQQSNHKKFKTLGKRIIKTLKSELKKGSINAHPILAVLEAEENPSKPTYDKAITSCARLGLIHYQAIMCERAGLFFLELDDKNWGEFYLEQAYTLYGDWGASGKCEQLQIQYPEFLQKSSLRLSATSSALKGRSRYSSQGTDMIKAIDFAALSQGRTSAASSITTDTSSRSSTTSGSSGAFDLTRSATNLFADMNFDDM